MHVIGVAVALSPSLHLSFLPQFSAQGSKAVCVCTVLFFCCCFNCKTICKLIIVICTRQFILRIQSFQVVVSLRFALAKSVASFWQSAQLAYFVCLCTRCFLAPLKTRLFTYRFCTFTKSQRWRRRHDIFFPLFATQKPNSSEWSTIWSRE